jgi:hypothetical protein
VGAFGAANEEPVDDGYVMRMSEIPTSGETGS